MTLAGVSAAVSRDDESAVRERAERAIEDLLERCLVDVLEYSVVLLDGKLATSEGAGEPVGQGSAIVTTVQAREHGTREIRQA